MPHQSSPTIDYRSLTTSICLQMCTWSSLGQFCFSRFLLNKYITCSKNAISYPARNYMTTKPVMYHTLFITVMLYMKDIVANCNRWWHDITILSLPHGRCTSWFTQKSPPNHCIDCLTMNEIEMSYSSENYFYNRNIVAIPISLTGANLQHSFQSWVKSIYFIRFLGNAQNWCTVILPILLKGFYLFPTHAQICEMCKRCNNFPNNKTIAVVQFPLESLQCHLYDNNIKCLSKIWKCRQKC